MNRIHELPLLNWIYTLKVIRSTKEKKTQTRLDLANHFPGSDDITCVTRKAKVIHRSRGDYKDHSSQRGNPDPCEMKKWATVRFRLTKKLSTHSKCSLTSHPFALFFLVSLTSNHDPMSCTLPYLKKTLETVYTDQDQPLPLFLAACWLFSKSSHALSKHDLPRVSCW